MSDFFNQQQQLFLSDPIGTIAGYLSILAFLGLGFGGPLKFVPPDMFNSAKLVWFSILSVLFSSIVGIFSFDSGLMLGTYLVCSVFVYQMCRDNFGKDGVTQTSIPGILVCTLTYHTFALSNFSPLIDWFMLGLATILLNLFIWVVSFNSPFEGKVPEK